MSTLITKGQIKAEIIADSSIVTKTVDARLVTYILTFPRMVLAQLNTHRMASKNSASSRAIPVDKIINQVTDNPYIPEKFPLKHRGMVADEWVSKGDTNYPEYLENWLSARDQAVVSARVLMEAGVSKQLVNRILEPWMMIDVVFSATEMENFFALRTAGDAQHEINVLACVMLDAYKASTPQKIEPGQWHMPFSNLFDEERLDISLQELKGLGYKISDIHELKRMACVARCARVSYLNFHGKDDYVADATLFYELEKSGHWSPFEHVARAMTNTESVSNSRTVNGAIEYGWSGNFRGFIQLRKTYPSHIENRHFNV